MYASCVVHGGIRCLMSTAACNEHFVRVHMHTPAYEEKLSISSNFLLLVSSYQQNLSNSIPTFFIQIYSFSSTLFVYIFQRAFLYCMCVCVCLRVFFFPPAHHVPSLQHRRQSRPSCCRELWQCHGCGGDCIRRYYLMLHHKRYHCVLRCNTFIQAINSAGT